MRVRAMSPPVSAERQTESLERLLALYTVRRDEPEPPEQEQEGKKSDGDPYTHGERFGGSRGSTAVLDQEHQRRGEACKDGDENGDDEDFA